jgi:thiol-disulfide isomerase/thioredoxin
MIGRLLDVVLRFSCFAKSAVAGDLVVQFAFVLVGLGVAFSTLAETSHAKNLSTQTPWISSTIPPQFPHQLSDLKAINTAAETELASRTQPKTLQFSKRGGLVVYWASWCSICKTQIEKIRRIQNELRQCDMNVVGIAIEEDQKAAQRATQNLGYEFPVYWTIDESQARKVASIQRIPVVLWVDQNGKVRRRSTGQEQLRQLLNNVQMYLEGLRTEEGVDCLTKPNKAVREMRRRHATS